LNRQHKKKGNTREIYWCSNCDVPLLSNRCGICGTKGLYSASDLRPIFSEERENLSEELRLTLPENIFYSRRRIIFAGKTLIRFTLKNGHFILHGNYKHFSKIQDSNFDKLFEKILKANKTILNELENESKKFIKATYKKYKSEISSIAVSFSGGKDSLVIADLVRKSLPNEKINLFFADTTLEYPDTYNYLEYFKMSQQFKVVVTTPDTDFFEMCEKLGPPSKILRWCCSLIKANAVNKLFNVYENKVLTFDGVRASESSNRSRYPRIIQNPKIHKQITARPIFEWPTFAVWLYILKKKLHFNSAYKKGFSRVGCSLCPYNSEYDDFLIRKFYFNSTNNSNNIFIKTWRNKYMRFVNLIKKTAIKNNNEEPEKYFKLGYWKSRKPNRQKVEAVQVSQKDNYLKFSFLNKIPAFLPEYLKPISKIRYSKTSPFFRSCIQNPGVISGFVGGEELLVSLEKPEYLQLIRKQIERSLNCVGCGSCLYVCPERAISIVNGKMKIDENKCIQCLKCVNYKNCIIDYKAKEEKIFFEGGNYNV